MRLIHIESIFLNPDNHPTSFLTAVRAVSWAVVLACITAVVSFAVPKILETWWPPKNETMNSPKHLVAPFQTDQVSSTPMVIPKEPSDRTAAPKSFPSAPRSTIPHDVDATLIPPSPPNKDPLAGTLSLGADRIPPLSSDSLR